MSTTKVGRQAETVAAEFLQAKGCHIIAQNWRTRQCEIDIVATRENEVFFCEVKYRRSTTQGSGLAYITPKKIAQMQFAARLWLARNNWTGPWHLSAIEVSGPGYCVTAAIRDIDEA